MNSNWQTLYAQGNSREQFWQMLAFYNNEEIRYQLVSYNCRTAIKPAIIQCRIALQTTIESCSTGTASKIKVTNTIYHIRKWIAGDKNQYDSEARCMTDGWEENDVVSKRVQKEADCVA